MESRFDAVTREMGTIDRKTSLKVLGGSLAALAAARPLGSAAKKKGGKKGDKGCRSIEKAFKAYWSEECGANQTCRENLHACSAHLGACKGEKYLACVSNLAF
jgi:hypothetical protein